MYTEETKSLLDATDQMPTFDMETPVETPDDTPPKKHIKKRYICFALIAVTLLGIGVAWGVSSLQNPPESQAPTVAEKKVSNKSTVDAAANNATAAPGVDKAKVEEKAEEAKQNVSETPAASTTNNSSNSSGNTSNNASTPSTGGNSSAPTPAPDPTPTPAPAPGPPAHVHTPVAVTKQVEKYEQQWVPNWVTNYFYTCSYCGTHTYSSSEAKAHQKQEGLATGSGHSYYSDSSTVDEGSYQNVFVGYETIPDGYVCSGCGTAM